MKSVILKDGSEYDVDRYFSDNGIDITGTTGRPGAEGWLDLFKDKGDVLLSGIQRKTGREVEIDFYKYMKDYGYEVDKEASFKKQQEIIQIQNEKAERDAVKKEMERQEKEFGVDFSMYYKWMPGNEKYSKEMIQEMFEKNKNTPDELSRQLTFPYTEELKKSGKFDEKWGGWFPKKWGSYAMDVASLAVRTPLALVDDVIYNATKGESGAPFSVSMSQVGDYGLNDGESISQHFDDIQEAFRYDPKRVLKDLGRESVRDPISGLALASWLVTGGADTPLVGGRAGIILASLSKKYKGFSKGAQTAKKLKKSMSVMSKVEDKIERLNPVSKALAKTGITVTSEGVAGAAQGYMSKIFMGGEATINDAIVEGVEEGAFGFFASTALNIPRTVWDKLNPKQQSLILKDKAEQVKLVQDKLDKGIPIDALSKQEAALIKYTTQGSGVKVGFDEKSPTQIKATENGTIINRNGKPELVPITENLPADVDINDAKKQRENPAHITKADKVIIDKERKQRLENSKMLKEMAKESKLFDENLQKEIDNIINESAQEMDNQIKESENSNEEKRKGLEKDFELISDISKDTDFQTFYRATGSMFNNTEEIRAAYVNFKVQEEHARNFKNEFEKESEIRKKNREKLLSPGKKGTGRIIVEPEQILKHNPGGKYLQSLHNKVKSHMQSKGKSPSDIDVRKALEKGYKIPAKYKEQGSGLQKKERAYENKIINELLATGEGVENSQSVLAKKAPDEFTLGKVYFKKVSSKDTDIVKFKDVNGKVYEFSPDEAVFMDPEHSEIISPSSFKNFEDLDENFAYMLSKNDPYLQELMESRVSKKETNEEQGIEEELSQEAFVSHLGPFESETDFNEPIAEKIDADVMENSEKIINELTPIRDAFFKKEPSEADVIVFGVIDKIHNERSEINEQLKKRASLRKQLENIEIKKTSLIEKISRNSSKKREKIENRDFKYTEWEKDGTNPIPPEKADYSKEDDVIKNASEELKKLDEKYYEVEAKFNEFEDLDQLDYNNQLAYRLFNKSKVNGFKSFRQKVLGEKPKKHEKNVSSKKWDERIRQIKQWEIKNDLVNEMLASSFPGLYGNHPELVDMLASLAWKNKIPNSLKEAKNKASMLIDGQRGSINTAVLKHAAVLGGLTAYTGGPFTGLAAHIGINIVTKMHKRFFRFTPGKFLLHSVRSQLLEIPSFKRIVPKIDQAFILKNRINSNYQIRFEEVTKNLSPEELAGIRPYIEGKLDASQVGDGTVYAAEKLRGMLLEWAHRLNQQGMDIKPNKNYFPRVYDPGVFENMDASQAEEIIQYLMKQDGNIDRADAAAIIKSVYDVTQSENSYSDKKRNKEFYEMMVQKSVDKVGVNKVGVNYVTVTKDFNRRMANIKAKMGEKVMGNVAFSRDLPDMPDFVYQSDITGVVKDYFHGATNFVVHREKFGKGLELINDALFAQFGDKKTGGLTKDGERFKSYIEAELFNKSLVLDFWGSPVLPKMVEPFTRYQYYSKLMTSILAPARNMVTAAVMSNAVHGFSASTVGLMKFLGDTVKGHPFRNAHLAGVITDAAMKDALGQELFTPKKIEKIVEKIHPFPNSEKIVRTVAYNGAKVYAKRLFNKAINGSQKSQIKAREQLTYYLGEDRVNSDIAKGELSTENMELIAAQGASDVAGHARVMNLSPFMNTPEGKLVFQYRRIAFHNTVVLKDKIFLPATKGDFGPIIRWGLSVGMGIPAIGVLTSMVFGEREKEEDMSSMGAEAWGVMKSINTINSLGLFGDFAASYEQGTGWGIAPVVGSFAGPSASSVLNLGSDLLNLTVSPEKSEDIVKRAVKRELPGLSQGARVTGIDFFEKK